MPPGTSQPQRYTVDEITEQTFASLQMPWGRTGRKKTVAQGNVQPPDLKARYHGKPIPLDYATVYLAWMFDEFENDELDFPSEEGYMTIAGALGMSVL